MPPKPKDDVTVLRADPPTLESLQADVDQLKEQRRQIREDLTALRREVREHVRDHKDAGYDLRNWKTQSGLPDPPVEEPTPT